ncbi:MAG: diacylglycerol kinase family lipid kinase, partial [Dehalococcoidia bacterium]|nr:diacylglycerol kinase family lipid kinase [Dehalococcoidia bacterium]
RLRDTRAMTQRPGAADLWVVLNPKSRFAGHPRLPEEIGGRFAALGLRARVISTSLAGEGAQLAAEAVARGVRAVVAAGGDGTVNDILQGLANTPTALGLIPLGTGNALAHYLGLPERDLDRACAVIAAGHTRLVDLGRADGRHFVAMSGAGLDAQVVADLSPQMKAQMGKWGFALRFFATVMHGRPRPFHLRTEGDEPLELQERLWAVVICNSSQYTWRLSFAPQARDDDGLLDVVAFRGVGRLKLLRMVIRFFLGRPVSARLGYVHCQARRVEVAAEPPALWHVEGEVMGRTPVAVEVCPQALRVLVPLSGQGHTDSLWKDNR